MDSRWFYLHRGSQSAVSAQCGHGAVQRCFAAGAPGMLLMCTAGILGWYAWAFLIHRHLLKNFIYIYIFFCKDVCPKPTCLLNDAEMLFWPQKLAEGFGWWRGFLMLLLWILQQKGFPFPSLLMRDSALTINVSSKSQMKVFNVDMG